VTEVSRSGTAGATRAAERREITGGAAARAVMFAPAMSVRIALVCLVLVACAEEPPIDPPDDGCRLEDRPPGCETLEACMAAECGGQRYYDCDSDIGDWEDVFGEDCPYPVVEVSGTLVIAQVAAEPLPACTEPLLARNPLVVDIAADGTLDVDLPVTLVDGGATDAEREASIDFRIQDDWNGEFPLVAYTLRVDLENQVRGEGRATLGACEAEVEVDAVLCPADVEACGVLAEGWSVHCFDSWLLEDELTRYAFCAPGETEPACEAGGVGPLAPVGWCFLGCADTTVQTFATRAEYDAFDPQTLCVQ
jgi:hypothetical protein